MWKITGDRHGNFSDLSRKVKDKDKVIILGDSGINYFMKPGEKRKYRDSLKSVSLKERLKIEFPNVLFFCIQGNHEARASLIEGYNVIEFCGAPALVQKDYPNIIFAIDGEIYNILGKNYIVIGGAYSIDKEFRTNCMSLNVSGNLWFEEEQPDKEIKKKVEEKLDSVGWKVHGVLSHTAPLKYEPTFMFLPFVDQSTVDKTTEEWLDKIEDRLDYDIWYYGHYHADYKKDKTQMLYKAVYKLK